MLAWSRGPGAGEILTDSSSKVEYGESEQYPNISPPVVVADVQGQEELVADRVLAVVATGGGVRVVDVTTEALYELLRPCTARLAGRGVELDELVRLAPNSQAAVSLR